MYVFRLKILFSLRLFKLDSPMIHPSIYLSIHPSSHAFMLACIHYGLQGNMLPMPGTENYFKPPCTFTVIWSINQHSTIQIVIQIYNGYKEQIHGILTNHKFCCSVPKAFIIMVIQYQRTCAVKMTGKYTGLQKSDTT